MGLTLRENNSPPPHRHSSAPSALPVAPQRQPDSPVSIAQLTNMIVSSTSDLSAQTTKILREPSTYTPYKSKHTPDCLK